VVHELRAAIDKALAADKPADKAKK